MKNELSEDQFGLDDIFGEVKPNDTPIHEPEDHDVDYSEFDDPFEIEDVNHEDSTIKEDKLDLISEILKDKGISDITKIKYQNEDGEIEEVDFNSLPLDEQLEIIKYSEDNDYDLEDPEIELINTLRSNDLTPEDFINYIKQLGVNEYLDNNLQYEIDNYTDDELFMLDLKEQIEDISDEELTQALDREKENPELFKKKIDKTRESYKIMEKEYIENKKKESSELDDQKKIDTRNNVIQSAIDLEYLHGLDLDNDDKNEALDFLFGEDVNGVSKFKKYMDTPEGLFKLAWYASKGEEAFNMLHDYYRKQIDSSRQNKSETKTTTKARVVESTTKKTEKIPRISDISEILNKK